MKRALVLLILLAASRAWASPYDATSISCGAGETLAHATLVAGADDASVRLTSGSYPPTGSPVPDSADSTIFVDRWFTGTSYSVSVGLLNLTASLPAGANVTQAELQVYNTAIANIDALSVIADYYTWGPATGGDYTVSAGSGTAFAAIPIANISLTVPTQYFPLTNLGSIATNGATGIRLTLSAGTPSAGNRMAFCSAGNCANPAQLNLCYTIVGTPTATPTATKTPTPSSTPTETPTQTPTLACVTPCAVGQACERPTPP